MKTKIKIIPLFMSKEDSNGPEVIGYKNSYIDHQRPCKPDEERLELMADLLDQKAESCNAHDFVCCHRGLAVILHQEFGREKATKIMRRLVNYSGLFGLVGVCGEGDVDRAEKELGVSLSDWSDWEIKD